MYYQCLDVTLYMYPSAAGRSAMAGGVWLVWLVAMASVFLV